MWTAPVVTMADPMPGYVSFSYGKLSNFPVFNRYGIVQEYQYRYRI
jgi:hypothetical protein